MCIALATTAPVFAAATGEEHRAFTLATIDQVTLAQRVKRFDEVRALPSVSREALILAAGHAERTRPIIARLRSAIRDLAAADESLLRHVRTVGGHRDLLVRMAASHATSISFDAIDRSIATIGREIDLIDAHLSLATDSSSAGDREVLRHVRTLAALGEQLRAFSDLRMTLDAGLEGRVALLQSVAHDATLDVLASRRRGPVELVRNAAVDLTTAVITYGDQQQMLADGAGRKQAALELDAARVLEAQLLATHRTVNSGATSDNVVTRLATLSAERRATLSRLFPSSPQRVPSAGSPLLWAGMVEVPEPSSPLARQWLQLQRDLLAWSTDTGTAVHRLAPRWRERNRALVAAMATFSADAPRLHAVQTMVAAQETLLRQLEVAPGVAPSRAAPNASEADRRRMAERWLDQALTVELLLPLELELVNMTGAAGGMPSASGVSTGPNAKAVAGLAELAAAMRALGPDERALAASMREGEVLWSRFDTFLDRLIAERAAMWAQLQRTGSTPAIDPLHAYSVAVNEALRAAARSTEDDWRVRRMLREASRADPIARYAYGRPRQVGFRYAVQHDEFIGQALREVSGRTAIAREVDAALDAGAPAERRVRALVELIAPLGLAWDARADGSSIALAVALPTAVVRISDAGGARPRIVVDQAAVAGERILVAAQGSDPAMSFGLLAAQAAAPHVPVEQSKGFPDYMQQQVQKNRWSYYLTAGGGAALGLGACIWCPAAAPAILYGAYTAVGVQVAKDAAFAGAHEAIDTAGQPQNRESMHRSAEHVETAVTVAIAAYSVHSAYSAARTPAVVAREVETAADAARVTQAGVEEARTLASNADTSRRVAAEMSRIARDAGNLDDAAQAAGEAVAEGQQAIAATQRVMTAEANASTASRALREVVAAEPHVVAQTQQLIEARNKFAAVQAEIATLQREIDAGRTTMQSSLETAGIARETGDMVTRLQALKDFGAAERGVADAAQKLETLRRTADEAKDALDTGRLTFVQVAAVFTTGETTLETARVMGETISESGIARPQETSEGMTRSADASTSTATPEPASASTAGGLSPAEVIAAFPTDAERRGGRTASSAPIVIGGTTPGRFGSGTLDQEMRQRAAEVQSSSHTATRRDYNPRGPTSGGASGDGSPGTSGGMTGTAPSSDAGFPNIVEAPLPTGGIPGRYNRYRVERVEQGTIAGMGMGQHCTYYYYGSALLRPEDVASHRQSTIAEHVAAWQRMSRSATLHKVVVNLYFWPLPANPATEPDNPLPADRIECR